MEAVLTHPKLVNCLSKLEIRHPSIELRQWVQQKHAHHRKMALTKELYYSTTSYKAGHSGHCIDRFGALEVHLLTRRAFPQL